MHAEAPAILVVDDVELNRAILYEIFRDRFEVIEAGSGPEAMEIIASQRARIALVLLDMVLPKMDGLQVLNEMRERSFLPGIPVVMIASGLSSDKVAAAMQMGVKDFIERPFNVEVIKSRVLRLVECEQALKKLDDMVNERTQELYMAGRFVIDVLSSAIEFRSGEAGLHTRRVSLITRLLCQTVSSNSGHYEFSESMIEDIVWASTLHDVGMIIVPDSILKKPGRLDTEEYELMKRHTIFGVQILENIPMKGSERFLSYCRDICLCHHERWDGKGYPNGIAGNDIPIWAQVVSLADVYDALTSVRVYKPAYTNEQALQMIERGECGVFNPELIMMLGQIDPELSGVKDETKGFSQRCFFREEEGVIQSDLLLPRTLNLLEYEREQYKAFASLSGEILIDYDSQNDILSFSGRYQDHFEGETVVSNAFHSDFLKGILYPQDSETLNEAIIGISPSTPTLKVIVRLLTKRGWYEWYEVVVRTLWSDGDQKLCMRGAWQVDQHRSIHSRNQPPA